MSSDEAIVAFYVIFVLEAVTIIIGNTFTIFVFWSQRLYHKRSLFLLVNLAVADLLVGITELIVLATKMIPRSVPSALNAFGSFSSVLFLALISLERVYAVLWPLRHRVIRNRVYVFSIIIVWSLGLCAFTLIILSMYYTNTSMLFFTLPITFFSFISLLLICASYLAIRTRLRFTPNGIESHKRQSTERNLRLSRTFFIVVALSLVFWFPAFVVYTIKEVCSSSCIRPAGVWIVTALHLANSMINPFVYSFRMPIFKDTLRHCWRKRRQHIKIRPVRASWLVWGRGRSFSPRMDHTVNSPDIVLSYFRNTADETFSENVD